MIKSKAACPFCTTIRLNEWFTKTEFMDDDTWERERRDVYDQRSVNEILED